jgi:hypothetical protein
MQVALINALVILCTKRKTTHYLLLNKIAVFCSWIVMLFNNIIVVVLFILLKYILSNMHLLMCNQARHLCLHHDRNLLVFWFTAIHSMTPTEAEMISWMADRYFLKYFSVSCVQKGPTWRDFKVHCAPLRLVKKFINICY